MRKALIVIPILALIAAIVYSVIITGEKDTLEAELESVQSSLASTEAELTSTEAELTSTEAELTSTEAELTSTEQTLSSVQSELTTTKADLTGTESELASTENQLASARQTLTSLQDTLSDTQEELTIAQETLEGLGITLSTSNECFDVDLIDNSTATNPTWSQLRAFLSQDQTEENEYIKDVYDCSQFSRDVHNNAEAAGIRAAEVHVEFRNEVVSHALNAFLTTDYGLVYACCTEADTIARVKAGKEYRAVEPRRITKTNIRNDYWWDKLSSYYYIGSSPRDQWVPLSIEIYW